MKTPSHIRFPLTALLALSFYGCAVETSGDPTLDEQNAAGEGVAEPGAAEENTGEVTEALGVYQVCITASTSDFSGTANSLTIGFYDTVDAVHFSCVLPNGVGRGQSACCEPYRYNGTPQTALSVYGLFFRFTGSDNTDGLMMTNMSANTTIGTKFAGKFTNISDEAHVDCTGCVFGMDCESCWIDRDSHKNCKGITISTDGAYGQIGDNSVFCYSR
jgi:hypothetical protein